MNESYCDEDEEEHGVRYWIGNAVLAVVAIPIIVYDMVKDVIRGDERRKESKLGDLR